MGKRTWHIFLGIAALTIMTLSSCVRNRVRVEVNLPPATEATFSVMYYASDAAKGLLIDQAVVVSHGKAEFECATVRPTLIYISGASNEPALALYAERGDKLTLTGDNPDPRTWEATGNSITEEMSEWRLANRDAIASRDKSRINRAVSEYVAKNPNSPATALILYLYFDSRDDTTEFERLTKQLKGKAADRKWIELTGRNDLNSTGVGDKAGDIILRTLGNGCDTLRLGVIESLIYVSSVNDETRKSDIALLREALGERKDSAALTITSVIIDPDSITWYHNARTDSLRGAVHAWMPLYTNDPAALDLGIRSTPVAIVTSKGKILYRGHDVREAISTAMRNK